MGLVIGYGREVWTHDRAALQISVLGPLGVLLGLHFSLNMGRKWMPFVHLAESIFAAFGYRDPQNVDLVEEDKRYWKLHPDQWTAEGHAPWVFRYLSR